jgi:hypothetical protein
MRILAPVLVAALMVTANVADARGGGRGAGFHGFHHHGFHHHGFHRGFGGFHLGSRSAFVGGVPGRSARHVGTPVLGSPIVPPLVATRIRPVVTPKIVTVPGATTTWRNPVRVTGDSGSGATGPRVITMGGTRSVDTTTRMVGQAKIITLGAAD